MWAYSINEEEKFRLENPENCIDNYFKRKIYNILNKLKPWKFVSYPQRSKDPKVAIKCTK